MVEPAYKPLMAPNSVSAPLSTSDTSVSWTNVSSAERASVWRHRQERFPAGRYTGEPHGLFKGYIVIDGQKCVDIKT